MSFNMLVDPLAKDYKGYLINWQFYNGILISNCLSDTENFENTEYGSMQRIYTAFGLMYGKGIPPFDIAYEGLKWFLSCGQTLENDEYGNQSQKQYFSFDDDSSRLFSAFMVKYGINLNKTSDLHFFEFVALINDLDKTAFRNVVDLRMLDQKDMKNYSKEQKAEIIRQKKKFAIKNALEKQYTQEQKQAIDHFEELLNGKPQEKQE